MTATIDVLQISDVDCNAGVITPATNFVFRSKSGRWFWLIQLSEEMWKVAKDGETYTEKLEGLIKILLTMWSSILILTITTTMGYILTMSSILENVS